MATRRRSAIQGIGQTVLVGMLMAMLSSPSVGQRPRATLSTPSPAQALGRLAPGADRVRVRTLDGAVVEGWLVTPAEGTRAAVGILPEGEPAATRSELRLRVVPLDSVSEAWRQGSSVAAYAGGMATIGAIVGGLYLGALAYGLCDAATCDGTFMEGATYGAPFGAAVGALVGGLAGALSRRWVPLAQTGWPGPDLRWSVSAGRPWGATGGLESVSSLRASLGWDVARRTEAYAEVARLGLGGAAEPFAWPREGGPFANEDGRILSWLGGLGYRVDERGLVRLRAGAGVAGTAVDAHRTDGRASGTADPSERRHALHLAGAVELGWHPWSISGWGFGFRGGIDWFSGTPWGRLTTLSVSLATWH
jgi:hypothetical protein